jgi:prepilin-type N-terminal cleavage/methylation domain-containing protein
MKSSITTKKYFKEGGFTMIELIISIFVLSVAVVGIFSVFSIMSVLTSDSVNNLTGTYLAQEGMEIVRNIRDTNWLNMDAGVSGATWVDWLTSDSVNHGINCTITTGTGCEADYTTGTNIIGAWVMSTWASRYLYINPSGFYNYTSGAQIKFKRKIIIAPVTDVDGNSSHIIKVTVQVSWNKKATILNSGLSASTCAPGNNCIIVEETLYDWYYPYH